MAGGSPPPHAPVAKAPKKGGHQNPQKAKSLRNKTAAMKRGGRKNNKQSGDPQIP